MYSPQMLNALLVAAPAFRMEIVPRLTGVVGATDDDEAAWWTRKLLGGGGQGAIIITTEPSQALLGACATVSLPIVTIDCYGTIALDLPSVSSNNFAGGYSAAQHLLTLGHSRIGLIRGADNASFSRERAFGFLAALSEHDLTVPEGLLIEAGFDYEGGLRAGRTMLDRADRPTAIAANCDSVAIGVIEAARQLGLRVPQDVSVVGFDDTKLAMWSTPQLTTVNQPLGDIARVALRMMSRLLDGQEPDSPHVQLATKLVLRDSTARPTDGLAQ
jgi:LacI family transcriptional regulator